MLDKETDLTCASEICCPKKLWLYRVSECKNRSASEMRSHAVNVKRIEHKTESTTKVVIRSIRCKCETRQQVSEIICYLLASRIGQCLPVNSN